MCFCIIHFESFNVFPQHHINHEYTFTVCSTIESIIRFCRFFLRLRGSPIKIILKHAIYERCLLKMENFQHYTQNLLGRKCTKKRDNATYVWTLHYEGLFRHRHHTLWGKIMSKKWIPFSLIQWHALLTPPQF